MIDLERDALAALAKDGWRLHTRLKGDMSPRRFVRMARGDETAILMLVPKDGLGHGLQDFLTIGDWIADAGLNVPNVLDGSAAQRWLLLQDFGDVSFQQALVRDPAQSQEIYTLALDALEALQKTPCDLDIPVYQGSYTDRGHRRIVDWFVPIATGRAVSGDIAEDYMAAWAQVIDQTGFTHDALMCFAHRDYHVENLMFVDDAKGLHQCGIIDFQGAMHGHPAYDFGNLLEDPRHEIADELRDTLYAYWRGKNLYDGEAFDISYRILTTQFHCRVIGQFIKILVTHDNAGYLRFLPRLFRYMARALKNPTLEPLATFFAALHIDFSDANALNVYEKRVRACEEFIADSAF